LVELVEVARVPDGEKRKGCRPMECQKRSVTSILSAARLATSGYARPFTAKLCSVFSHSMGAQGLLAGTIDYLHHSDRKEEGQLNRLLTGEIAHGSRG